MLLRLLATLHVFKESFPTYVTRPFMSFWAITSKRIHYYSNPLLLRRRKIFHTETRNIRFSFSFKYFLYIFFMGRL